MTADKSETLPNQSDGQENAKPATATPSMGCEGSSNLLKQIEAARHVGLGSVRALGLPKEDEDGLIKMFLAVSDLAAENVRFKASYAAVVARAEAAEARVSEMEAMRTRKTFPILSGPPARVDWQLVADHAKQAMANHGQSVQALANRGGLSWCELFAVLHNRRWEKIDTNDAIIACRALEARYLAALTPPSDLAARVKGGAA